MAIFLEDGRGYPKLRPNLETALAEMKDLIEVAQVQCDPEWPAWIEDAAIYEAPEDAELPNEDGTVLYVMRQTNFRDPDPGSGCDYFCDYEVAAPEPRPEAAP